MSVARQLGFSPDGPSPVDDNKWRSWCAAHPSLKRFSGVEEMWRFIQESPIEVADELLWIWAQLAAEDGGNDLDAASWLAWALVGGVSAMGRRMRGIPNLDQTAAAALWLEVRTFPWRTRHHVAGNVMHGVRGRVFGEVGRSNRRDQRRSVERRLVLVPDYDALSSGCDDGGIDALFTPSTPWEELVDLLDWATTARVISTWERVVLLTLVEVWDQLPQQPQVRAAAGGFCGNRLADLVGARLGVSGRTVRRAARRSMTALTQAAGQYLKSA